jgi:hypothetical protein
MTKPSKKSPVTRQDRADVTATAQAFYKATRLHWSICMLAAWQAWRDQKNAELRTANEGSTYGAARAFDTTPAPYVLKDAAANAAGQAAWWAVYGAMERAKAA